MKAPADARYVAVRCHGIVGQRVAIILNGKVHLWIGCSGGGLPSFNPKARTDFEIVREATRREAIIGTVL